MDMFIDRLGQKLTAQEIIKANTAADVEEVNRLKNQAAEYREGLARLQKLIEDSRAELSGIRKEEAGVVRLVGENTEEMKALQRDVEQLRAMLEQLRDQLSGSGHSMAGEVESLSTKLEVLSTAVTCERESLTSSMGSLSVSVKEKIDQLCGQLEAQAYGGLSERLDAVEEGTHKECVKVYRNVQAVMMEESKKQNEALTEMKTEVSAVKREAALGKNFAIMALVFSALSFAGVLFQILVTLGVLSL